MTDEDNGADDTPSRNARSNWGLDRRRYLQALGAMGLLGSGTTAATAADDGLTVEVPDDWEESADERIAEHRTAEMTVDVIDADGNAVEGADVDVEMREHAFGFGTAVNAGTLIDDTEPGDNYRRYITELFNKAVFENRYKWRFWERGTELADTATEWVLDRGLALRGHPGIWGAISSYAVPNDVVRALGETWEGGGVTDPEFNPDYVRQRTFNHLDEIITRYGDDITSWDVNNEVVNTPTYIDALEGDDVDPAEAPVLPKWYRAAREAAPDGVGMSVNDYNVLVGPYEETREAYEREIQHLLNHGIDLDGIGLQGHFHENQQLTPAQTIEGLNRYTGYGADLLVTEFDTADADWDDEDKGEFLHRFLKTVYSHPATTDFLMWGFWDGRHWRNDAPLFYEDWSKKPAYDAYTDLVFDEWWTEESGATDADGRYTTRGFEGTYAVTAEADGLVGRETVTVGDTGSVTVELAPGSVAAIDLDVPQQVLRDDETTTLGVTLTDTDGTELSVSNDDLRFESSSPEVVAVSEEGVVAAADTGAATVTVTATAEGDTAVGSARFFANQEATSADADPTGPGVVVDDLAEDTTYESPHAVGVSVSDDDTAVTGQSVTLDGDAWAGGEVTPRGRHVLEVEATSEAGVTTTTEVGFAVENAENSLFARIDPSTTDATVGQRVEFGVEDTTDGDTWVDSLDWSFGDGTSATGWWNAHRFDAAGAYTVQLTATDDDGNTTTDSMMIWVSDLDGKLARQQPSTTEAAVGERVTFDVEDTSGQGRWIQSLEWSFDDISLASGWWAAHRFDEAGTYTVRLTATDNLGYSTTHDVEITVG